MASPNRITRLVCAALAACLWQVGALAREIPRSVLPGIGAEASRNPVDVNAPPWRGIGVLQTEGGFHCTGALVGPRTVLTAAHCLFGPNSLRYLQPGSVHFLVGYARGEYAGHSRATTYVTGRSDALDPDGRHAATAPDADWAVVTLASPLGTPDRVLPMLWATPPPGTPLALAGYEQDRLHVMVADAHCSLIGVARFSVEHTMLSHSCAGTRGASGGPLLAQMSDGSWAVIGIVSTARVGSPGGYAVPLSAIDPKALER